MPTRLLLVPLIAAGCGSKVTCADSGGPVSGTADAHCDGVQPQVTDPAVCHELGDTDSDAAGDSGGDEAYTVMHGTSGDDDDCKYHVAWSASTVCRDEPVTFTVTATKLADGQPLTGADPYVEAYLTDTHPANTGTARTTEDGGGAYTIGPVTFDAPGDWTVRFHFYADCADVLPTSQHGHAAFFLHVP